MQINELINLAHSNAVEKGFYDKPVHTSTLIALGHSEFSEALEADRVGDFSGVSSELADVVIRVADMCGYLGVDLEKEIKEKMSINYQRTRKHGKLY